LQLLSPVTMVGQPQREQTRPECQDGRDNYDSKECTNQTEWAAQQQISVSAWDRREEDRTKQRDWSKYYKYS
jgi:hypothetical protein